jgi:hypothetical protein
MVASVMYVDIKYDHLCGNRQPKRARLSFWRPECECPNLAVKGIHSIEIAAVPDLGWIVEIPFDRGKPLYAVKTGFSHKQFGAFTKLDLFEDLELI